MARELINFWAFYTGSKQRQQQSKQGVGRSFASFVGKFNFKHTPRAEEEEEEWMGVESSMRERERASPGKLLLLYATPKKDLWNFDE